MARKSVVGLLVLILLLSVVGLGGAAPRAALSDNMVGCWALDETSGVRYDSSTYGHSLTDVNTVGYTSTGKISNAAHFIAVNSERLSIAHNSTLSLGDVDFSISTWVWMGDMPSDQAAIWDKTYASNGWVLQRISDSTIRLISLNNSTTTSVIDVSGVPTSTWIFIATWHDATAGKSYVQINNGTVYSTTTTHPADSGNTFGLGAKTSNGSVHFNGYIDNVTFHKRVLTTEERTAIYNGGNGLACADIINPPTATPTNTATNTPTNTPTPTPTPDFTTWPYPKSKSSSGFAENGGATLNNIYAPDGVVLTYTEAAGPGAQWVQLNYSGIPGGLDVLHWHLYAYYSGAHSIKAQCYSVGLNDWTNLTGNTTDMPQGSSVSFYEIAVNQGTCVSSGDLQLRLLHTANGIGTHLLVFDAAILHAAAAATATPLPPTATPGATSTNTPLPTATFTPTPTTLEHVALPDGERMSIDRTITYGEIALTCVGGFLLVVLALFFIIAFVYMWFAGPLWFPY
jgi:hypothetical protein